MTTQKTHLNPPKFIMIAYTIKMQARNNELKHTHRKGKLFMCSVKGSNRVEKTTLSGNLT